MLIDLADLALNLLAAWWPLILTFLFLRVKVLNFSCAWLLGAPRWGISTSAHLYALEIGRAGTRRAAVQLMRVRPLVRFVRLFVDGVCWVFLGHVWHCQQHYERQAAFA